MAKKQFKAESKRLLDLMIHAIYTHREIFLRELISNASDAMDKLAYKALTDDQIALDRGSLCIRLTADREQGTLTVSDRGIGMSKEELEENLGTICKSGSLGFKENMEPNEEIDIIGQFGVGFYAAFMVASKVTVITRKYNEDTAWKWVSDGVEGYTVTPCQKDTVGTDVILTLKSDSEEEEYTRFLEEYTLRGLVKKYSDYIRYPICMEVSKSRLKEDAPEDKPEYETYREVETLNSMVPLWARNKKDVTEEEYNTFYREKFMDYQKPLRVIHTSAEGTVSYKALLYIPAKAPYDFNSKEYKAGLQLYSSGVMIMEACEDLVPEYFRFVRGVVDSQDLSLNISREMLQHDRQLSVIARNIEKKIKAELSSMLENDRSNYEEFFKVFGRQLKYGAVMDYGTHKEAVQELLLFHSHKENKPVTLGEYVAAMPEEQKKIYYLCGQSTQRLSKLPQVKTLEEKGFDILLMTDEVDGFVPQGLMQYAEKDFCDVATQDLGLQSEEEKKELEEKSKQKKALLDFVKETMGEKVVQVRFSSDLSDQPVNLVSATGMSFEMEKYMRRVQPELDIPSRWILELNASHPAVSAMEVAVAEAPEKAADYARLLCAQAQLLADLPLEDPAEYTALVCKLMK